MRYELVTDITQAPEPPVHVIMPRDEFEKRARMSWCRRCLKPVLNDRNPDKVTASDCEIVKIGLR